MAKQKLPEAVEAEPKNDDVRPEHANEEPLEPALAPTEPAPAQPAAEKLTPAAWAQRLGMIVHADRRLPQQETHAKPEHAAADSLHGWAVHAYNYQAAADAFLITEADYRAALVAAGQHPLVPPHAAALPPSQVARFADFKPKAAANR